MNIAFITPIFPWPDSGGGLHTISTIRRLIKGGHKIYIFSSTKAPFKKRHKQFLKNENIKIGRITYNPNIAPTAKRSLKLKIFLQTLYSTIPFSSYKFYSQDIKKSLEKYLSEKKVDMLWIDHIHQAYYILHSKEIFSVIQSHGVESNFYKRMFLYEQSLHKKLFALSEFIKYFLFEKKYLPKFTKIFAISKLDKNRLYNITRKDNIDIISPHIKRNNLIKKSLKKDKYKIILFVGFIGWYPNRDGIKWFIKRVLPLIKKSISNIKLKIIGKLPQGFKKSNDRNIQFVGYQKDITKYYHDADVFISPIRYGEGIRYKILNAMAHGIPIVSTSTGIEGIEAQHNKHILITDSPEQFSASIIKLLNDRKLRNSLIDNCYRLINRKYRNERIII